MIPDSSSTLKYNEFIRTYFSNTLAKHGTTAKGADWRDYSQQVLRFAQLEKIFDGNEIGSLTDYGCGYGAFLQYIQSRGLKARYFGIDCTEEMVRASQTLFASNTDSTFVCADELVEETDYTVVSGTFNYKADVCVNEWQEYVISRLDNINQMTKRGIAFNLLTSYSDEDRMQDHLFYANPGFFFDYCKRHFSRNVALLHDYGAYEFTILVRK